MKEIPLSQGYVALVDDDFFDVLSRYKWYYVDGKAGTHIDGNRNHTYMHQLIMATANTHLIVDHIDRNGLNNQRSNLRLCNTSQNIANSGPRTNNTSGFKGVYFCNQTRKWRAEIKYLGKKKCLGRYATKVEAALAYNVGAKQYFGEFAYQNEL